MTIDPSKPADIPSLRRCVVVLVDEYLALRQGTAESLLQGAEMLEEHARHLRHCADALAQKQEADDGGQ